LARFGRRGLAAKSALEAFDFFGFLATAKALDLSRACVLWN
jgi:hypothetical protein